MLHFKPEVRFHPAVALSVAIIVVNQVFDQFGVDVWISSGNDGKHKAGSLHYKDSALDFRIKNVSLKLREQIVDALRQRLAPQFDVIWEAVGTPNEHIHIE